MDKLKQSLSFSIFILFLIPSIVYSDPWSDEQIISTYPYHSYLQNAIDNETFNYNDLPEHMKHNYLQNKANSNPTSQVPISVSYGKNITLNENSGGSDTITQAKEHHSTFALVVFSIISIFFVLKLIQTHKILIRGGYTLLVLATTILGVIWGTPLLDDTGKVGATVIDASVFGGVSIAMFIRGSQTNYEYYGQDQDKTTEQTLPKGFGQRKSEPRPIIHSPIHKILLALGIIKVKKNG